MAVFRFSALSDGQSINFTPTADVLNFDQTTIAAADIRVTAVGSNIRVSELSSGKDVTLVNVSPLQLSITNVTFADGSRLLFGDTTSSTANDNLANSITGTAGNDLLQGFGGADTMNGGTGNDTYIVGTGDALSDTGGTDTVLSDVSWTLADGFENLTATGTAGIALTGNNAANLLVGNSGNNFFNPRGGDDTIRAGAGDDLIRLGGGGVPTYGTKLIDGGNGFDTLDFGGFAKSAIVVDLVQGTLKGGGEAGQGSATLFSIEGVIGDGFNDRISGSAAAESLGGGGGNDTLDGRGGNDTLSGGLGADIFVFATAPGASNVARQATDFVSATDKLSFDNAVFTALGSPGNFAAGDARFAAGAGFTSGQDANDRLVYNTATGQLFYDADGNGPGASVLVATLQGAPALAAADVVVVGPAGPFTIIQGTAGNDSLTGTTGDDSISGLAGNDTIDGLDGADTLRGGDGDDTLIDNADGGPVKVLDGGLGNDTYRLRASPFDNVVAAVSIVDAGGIDTVFSNEGLTLPDGIENLTLAGVGVRASGNGLDNVITVLRQEGFGGCSIDAGSGNDTLIGGAERDTMTGGAGNDVFVFTQPSTDVGFTQIQDFASGIDRLQFDNAGFTQIGGAGSFAQGDPRFVSGAGLTSAQDANDRLIYNTTDGRLFYDADGNGAGRQVLVAVLTGAPNLAATDIVVTGQAQPNPGQGTAGNDSLVGTEGNDSINGLGGNDTIDGRGGDDTLNGGPGTDLVLGGAGNDTLIDTDLVPAGAAPDTLDGGLGNDTYDLHTDNFFPFPPTVLRDAGGVDTVLAEGFTLPEGFENLVLFARDTDGAVRGTGNSSNNLITVSGSRDTGPDTIDGADGDDTLIGGFSGEVFTFAAGSGNYGHDSVDGGADGGSFDAFDALSFEGARSAVVVDMRTGTASGGGIAGSGSVTFTSIEEVRGGSFDDRLTAYDGVRDSSGNLIGAHLVGGAGNDTLTGGAASDTLTGGAGQDNFVFAAPPSAGNADQVADFGPGSDKLLFDNGVFTALGGAGNFAPGDARFASGAGLTSGQDSSDRLVYNTTTGQLFYDADGSGAGASQLVATLQGAPALTATDIFVTGQAQPSPVQGTAGNDSLTGTAGDDLLQGLAGNDTLNGLPGNDTLDAGTGADLLIGGAGNDTYIVDGPGDTVVENAGEGIDTVFSSASRTLDANVENLTLTGTADVSATGDNAANVLTGNSGNNFFNPRGGDDTIQAAAGNDLIRLGGGGVPSYGTKVIDGGAGFDTLDFGGFAKSAIVADLAAGTLKGGGDAGQGSATLTSIESVIGDAFNDQISGSAAAESLGGGAGNDTLDGRGGNDTLSGGVGADTFGFATAPSAGNVEQVTDFVSATDKLSFDNAVFTALGAAGNFAAGDARFAAGAGLTSGQDASDRLIYNTTTGQLFYDADGSGAGASQLVATLQGAPALAATDIAVTGQSGSTTIQGTEGNDTLTGTPGNDTIDGRGGNDLIRGLDGADSLIGGAGDDTLDGGAGTDTLDGGLGNDTYLLTHPLNPPDDVLIDAGGIDTIIVDGNSHGGVLPDGFENLTVRGTPPFPGFEPGMTGNAADNVLRNESNAPVMSFVGAGGNDTLIGGSNEDDFGFNGAFGNDVVDGGGGFDILFVGADSAASVDGRVGTVSGGGTGASDSVAFSNIEVVQGGTFADLLIASDAGMTLRGNSGNDTLVGGAGRDVLVDDFVPIDNPQGQETGNDSISGGAGDDQITIARGNDTVQGGAGNDVIFIDSQLFSSDIDSIDGGDGIDTVETFAGTDVVADLEAGTVTTPDGGRATLVGVENFSATHFVSAGPQGPVADIRGSSGANVLIGNQGGDTLDGRAGNDTLSGGGGADHFIFDQTPGAANADQVTDFASGADKLHLDARVMTALGASGNFAAGDARFFAAAGATGGHDADDRVVYNTSTGQVFYDADGNGGGAAQLVATLQTGVALVASDIVVDNGAPPADGQVITGTAGNDSLTGTDGNDTLDGGAGTDTMNGGLGNDTYVVTAGDVLSDPGGIDTVLSDINWSLQAGFENLTATGTGPVQLTGNNDANVLTGNSGNNFFNPRGGNDTIDGADGDDWVRLGGGGVPTYGNKLIDGNIGFDTLDFGGFARSAIVVDLAAGTLSGGGDAGQGSATLISIEQVIGDGFNDRLSGSAAAEALNGGGGGNDTIDGRGGNDTLTGGLGADAFVFDTAPASGNVDQVTDFVSATDRLNLENGVFTALGAAGNFAAGDARFASGAGFTSGRDASDRIVYDTTTGNLYYDADGNGAGAAQLFATVQGHPAVAATDITVI